MTDNRKKTILIIDDEETIRQSFSDYLEDLDFRTVAAENGRIGVEIFDREKVDLVLVDLRMPEMDGLEVLAHIREKSPDTPLIVVSGTGVIADAVAAIHQGAWDYLLKPVKDLSELAHAVDMALEKARLKTENSRYQQHLEQMVADRTKALKESEALLDATGKMAKVGGWELDAGTLERKWTKQTYRIFDFPLDFKPTEKVREHVHSDDREMVDTAMQLALDKGEPFDLEIRITTVTGNNLWIRSICIPQVVDGNVVKLKGTFQDITALKQAGEALKESEKRYRSVTELSPLGIGIVNTDGVFIDANQALASMLGYEKEEILDLAFKDVTHPDDLQREGELVQSLINNEKPSYSLEKRYRHKNGNYFWVHVTAAKMSDSAGDQVFLFGFVEDISKRKQMEAEREELINELQKALAEIKELRGFLPICSNCKKIRDDAGYWQQVETYITDRTDAKFSHSICPDCARKLYPDIYHSVESRKKR